MCAKRFLLALAAASALTATGCRSDENRSDGDGKLRLNINVLDENGDRTKSSVSASDIDISMLDIYLYDVKTDAVLKKERFYPPFDEITLGGLTVGRRYRIFAVANSHSNSEALNLSDLEKMSVEMGSPSQMSDSGIPMAGQIPEFTFDKGPADPLVLVRLAARYDISIDTSSLKGKFTVTGLFINNAASQVKPFADSKITSGQTGPGDRASEVDLSRLKEGKPIVLIMGENLQGNLLEGNTDPWAKVPDNIPSAQNCCTYLTVKGKYVNNGLTINDLSYNMYLGEDSSCNFDVRRNCRYSLTLSLTDRAAVLSSSWKVERGTIDDSRTIRFDSSVDSLSRNSSSCRTVIRMPENFDYDIFPGEGFSEAGLNYSDDGNGNVTITSSTLDGKSATGRLWARSWDRSRSCSCDITVMDWDSCMVINGGRPVLLWPDDTAKVVAICTTNPGAKKENVTSQAAWETTGSNGSILSESLGSDTLKFKSTKVGEGTISALWNGVKASQRSVVSTTASIGVLQEGGTIRVGDTVLFDSYVVFASGDTLFDRNVFTWSYLKENAEIASISFRNPGRLIALGPGVVSMRIFCKKDNRFEKIFKVTIVE